MVYDFHPYNKPTSQGKINLPGENKFYVKEYFNKNYYLEEENFKDIDIDLEKLIIGRANDENSYTLEELKEFAKQLNIEKISGMSKKDLINKIRMKLKLN